MRNLYTLIIAAIAFAPFASFGQTTAMDFQTADCNGNNVHLFSDLDAGQAVVLFYFMPNCSSCPPPASKIQAMANKINSNCPGMVKGYAYSYQNSTTCAYTSSWVTSNNLGFYTPMAGAGADQVAYYGGFGMPTVVLVGGTNHDVLWSTQNWVDSDTTTMRDLILGMSCVAGVDEISSNGTLQLFPNPSSDKTSISFNGAAGSYSVEIYDMAGKLAQTQTFVLTENGLVKKDIDLTALVNGMYTLVLSDGNFRKSCSLSVNK